ncbi:hypothetical protein GYMLUDRAFT_254829 [Collybiopsis luxurians FD-317 M1]|nr:hypothetical protein GYMLUDRAFT_254829 [Collybiopsis luxurians FD-317 M1]
MAFKPHQFLFLLTFFEYISLFGLRARAYHALRGLIIDNILIVWLPISIWMSFCVLGQCITEIQTSSTSLPLRRPVQEDLGMEEVAENLKSYIVLIAFAHTWLTFLHLFTVVEGDTVTSNNAYVPMLFTWTDIVMLLFATMILIIGFGKCLVAFRIRKDFEHWGYFFYLHRITSFILSAWLSLLWIIDLLEGRIEVSRR